MGLKSKPQVDTQSLFTRMQMLQKAAPEPTVFTPEEPAIELPPSVPVSGAVKGEEAVTEAITPPTEEPVSLKEPEPLLSSESLEARPIEERRTLVSHPPTPISYEQGVLHGAVG
jgi:hypothetical protein